MAKSEKLKKLNVGETKGVSGGTIYWSYDDNGHIRLFVAGREYALGPDAIRENFRLGLPHAAVHMNSVDEARRASLVEAAARDVNDRIIDDGERRRH